MLYFSTCGVGGRGGDLDFLQSVAILLLDMSDLNYSRELFSFLCVVAVLGPTGDRAREERKYVIPRSAE